MAIHGNRQGAMSQQLLLALAEQLKLPLLQIARQAELGQPSDLPAVRTTAESALKLIDSYLLGVRLSTEGQTALALEPVSVSSVLYDVATDLTAAAQFYGVQLDLKVAGRYGPVLANRRALKSALTSLGMALIESLPALDAKRLSLDLAAHKCRYGIVAGIYSDSVKMRSVPLADGRRLMGQSRQPLHDISGQSAAGIFVADQLFSAMQLKLQSSKFQNLHGLAAVLPVSPQLSLI